MISHFDKTLSETHTYVEQNCTDLKDVMTYITEQFEHYWQTGDSDKYQTKYGCLAKWKCVITISRVISNLCYRNVLVFQLIQLCLSLLK